MSSNRLSIANWPAGWCMLGLAVFSWSCPGCAPSEPTRQAVHGTITLDTKPVSGVSIVFAPVGSNQLGAVTEAVDGRFSMDASSGPSSGMFDVTVDTIEPDLEDFEQLRQAGSRPFSKLRIHPRYSKFGALKAEVRDAGENAFRFELTSK